MGAGHLHPMRYALGLARAAEEAGARIHEGTEVTAIDHGRHRVTFRTPRSNLRAAHAILAGNGYLPLIDRARRRPHVMPINSFIAATEPLGDRCGRES
jgi:gamma-glutamylputrescine oxidase